LHGGIWKQILVLVSLNMLDNSKKLAGDIATMNTSIFFKLQALLRQNKAKKRAYQTQWKTIQE